MSMPLPHQKFWSLRRVLAVLVWLACAIPRVGHTEDWQDSRNAGAFTCHADFPLRDEERVLREMTQLGQEISQTLELKLAPRKTEILLFRTRYNYQRYLEIRVPEGMNRPALFVKGGEISRVYAYRCNELATNLRHEGTHALLHGSLAFVPLWLDEGLAEYFEVPAAERARNNPHQRNVKWSVRLAWRPHLKNLASKTEMSEMDAKDYRDAWAIVHYLVHGPEDVRTTFLEYLHEVHQGGAPDTLDEQLERKFPDFDARVAQHFRSWR